MRATDLHKHRRGRSMAKTPYREKLKALRERAGLSGAAMAKALGYASPPGYFRHEQERHQGDKPIPDKKVQRLIPLFMGRGYPPITIDEIWALTEKGIAPRKLEPIGESGLLSIEYRIDPDTFVRPGASRKFGSSCIIASPNYAADKQFVVINTNGEHLHCVEGEGVSMGRRYVLSVAYDATELFEVVIASVNNNMKFVREDGREVTGEILGAIVGAYVKE